jgi:hypothetical protein
MASNTYYNGNEQYRPPPGPPQSQQQQYNSPQAQGYPPPQGYEQYEQPQNHGYPPPQQPPPNKTNEGYAQPPTYGQNFDNKEDFQQTFKIEKPKFNDLWAGILVRQTSFEQDNTDSRSSSQPLLALSQFLA